MPNMSLTGLDAVIEEFMEEWQVPGLALSVVHEGEPILTKAYGLRDVEAGLPVTTDTQFLLGNNTMSFTATGLGMLVDDGVLDWSEPVREYLPEFRLHDPIAADRITLLDLLSHRSGLPSHNFVWVPADRSRDELFAALRHLQPSGDVRSRFEMNDLHYEVAGRVLERVSGRSWEDFIHHRLMEPLGIKSFSYSKEGLEQADNAARPYEVADWDPSEGVRRRRLPYGSRSTAPAAGLNMAVSGMANYMSFHLAKGRFGGKELLSQGTWSVLSRPHVDLSGSLLPKEISNRNYGLGLFGYTYRGERCIAHGGGWYGWGNFMLMLPEQQLGIVIMTNRQPAPIRVQEILNYAVADRLLDLEPVPWLDRLKAQRQRIIAESDIEIQAHQAARHPDAPPRPLANYAGDYDHHAYGRMTITFQDGTLKWHYRDRGGDLTHRHYDIFEIPGGWGIFSLGRRTVTFGYDRAGRINQLSAPLEPEVDDIVFARAPSGDVLDAAFRKACAGTYQSVGSKHVVACIADDQLTLSTDGRPACHLVPYRNRVFSIIGQGKQRIEFQRSSDDTVDSIIFHQLDGTFLARRLAD
ncbi:MAG: serine hydrolase [Geminicoccales bacterium]